MKILLIEVEDIESQALRRALRDNLSVEFLKAEGPFFVSPPAGIDAMFLTLPAAERWSPDFKSREAQILPTTQAERQRGFPPFIVTGVNLRVEDHLEPLSQVRIILESMIEEIHKHNTLHTHKIKRLGILANTLADGVSTEALAMLLTELLKANEPDPPS